MEGKRKEAGPRAEVNTRAYYERWAKEKGPNWALEFAIQDVEQLVEYIGAHYTTEVLIGDIIKLRQALRRLMIEGAETLRTIKGLDRLDLCTLSGMESAIIEAREAIGGRDGNDPQREAVDL